MTNDLARIQFATTIIYHFIFPPVTIGLAFLVAILQTVWYRTDNPVYKRMTRFFGTLLLINVAIGVVTGLVQEFQFGMDWGAVLAAGRQHLRLPAGDGGPGGVLPGVDVPGAVAVRLGQAAAADPCCPSCRLPDLDLLRIPPPRQQAAIPGITGAEYATGSSPRSNTRCRSAVSRRRNLTPHQYGRKLTWQPIKLTRW